MTNTSHHNASTNEECRTNRDGIHDAGSRSIRADSNSRTISAAIDHHYGEIIVEWPLATP